jgi:hypothetical protein
VNLDKLCSIYWNKSRLWRPKTYDREIQICEVLFLEDGVRKQEVQSNMCDSFNLQTPSPSLEMLLEHVSRVINAHSEIWIQIQPSRWINSLSFDQQEHAATRLFKIQWLPIEQGEWLALFQAHFTPRMSDPSLEPFTCLPKFSLCAAPTWRQKCSGSPSTRRLPSTRNW